MTEEAAGELRQRLRADGWRSDLGWTAVGIGAAAGQAEARRTIAYLASVRAVDGGAGRVWSDGDVPVPAESDAREVYIAQDGSSDWHSELLEAPAETVTAPDVPVEPDESATESSAA